MDYKTELEKDLEFVDKIIEELDEMEELLEKFNINFRKRDSYEKLYQL